MAITHLIRRRRLQVWICPVTETRSVWLGFMKQGDIVRCRGLETVAHIFFAPDPVRSVRNRIFVAKVAPDWLMLLVFPNIPDTPCFTDHLHKSDIPHAWFNTGKHTVKQISSLVSLHVISHPSWKTKQRTPSLTSSLASYFFTSQLVDFLGNLTLIPPRQRQFLQNVFSAVSLARTLADHTDRSRRHFFLLTSWVTLNSSLLC